MPYVIQFNRAAIEDKIVRLARWLNLRTPTFEGFMQWTLDLRREVGIPQTLAELGVKTEHLDRFSEMAVVDPTASAQSGSRPACRDAQDVRGRHRREALMAVFPNASPRRHHQGGIMAVDTVTRRCWKDIVLLEQGRPSGGTTWHAAGLRPVAQRPEFDAADPLQHRTLFETRGRDRPCHRLETICLPIVARTEERMTLLRRSVAMASAQGVECEPLTPQQAGDKYPIMRTDDLVGAVAAGRRQGQPGPLIQ